MEDKKSDKFKRRRLPQSTRSQATVDCILQATKELLEKGSFSAVTTNHIAERAGVNINSLYQYFSTRESVALVLYETVASQAASSLRRQLIDLADEDIRKSLPKVIGALLRTYKENAVVLLRLPEELPELQKTLHALDMENLLRGAGRLFIERHRADLTAKELETSYYLIAHGVMGCLRSYILHPPGHLDDRKFVKEISRHIAAGVKIPE